MRFVAAVVCLVSIFNSVPATGQVKDFPYEAKVVADEAFVRSGAGDGYYPTQKLARDTVVIVHRHDPGGWFMIDPPEGSFSWIPERFVTRLSDTEGEVKMEDVAAFVGSEFGDEISLFQRRMKTGEKVQILGQRDIDSTSGMQSMLKVAPPKRERRWIPGSAVVPVDEQKRLQMNADPYAVPGNAKRPEGIAVTPSKTINTQTAMNGVTDTPEVAPSSQLAQLQSLRSEQKQLAEIDRKFREMILGDCSQWNLDGIEAEYRSLQDSAANRSIAGEIDMRYPAIGKYRRKLAKLMDLKQLTTQTESKDAELVGRHQSIFGYQAPVIASAGPESIQVAGTPPKLSEAFEAFLHRDTSNIASNSEPTIAEIPEQMPVETFPGGENAITPGSPQNRYIGAGIVQRSSDQGSGYVLTTPAGKVLADLKPSGNVRLEEFIGQQVGVQGSRWSEKEKRDIIEVSGLEAVRIRR